jgi:Holliday junction resolvase RusA-like endonuclease
MTATNPTPNEPRAVQVIYGQPPSKSNCYRIITTCGHGSLAKTAALRKYEEAFFLQCRLRGRMIDTRFKLSVDVYYASDRPDLDNAMKTVLDCLQACRAIKNDRLCAELRARKFIDKANPRIEFTITEQL